MTVSAIGVAVVSLRLHRRTRSSRGVTVVPKAGAANKSVRTEA
ncbi:hypothetical protein [Streptomyces sp. NBC_00996]|nr:hypothetical protein OG390_23295 [Streptomyces sp. NBC_00996]